MKNIFLFLAVILIKLNVIAQSSFAYNIKYDMQLNYSGLKKLNSELQFNNKKSAFFFKESAPAQNSSRASADSFYIEIIDTTTNYVITDLSNNLLVELGRLPGVKEPFDVVEKIPFIDWNISNESKRINSFKAIKATAKFRGRNYIVWFTPDLPTSFGPWKLHGLPGAILEAKDDMNQVVFIATSVDKVSSIDQTDKLKKQELTREYFKKKQNAFFDDMGKNIAAKMGRGFSVEVKTSNKKGIEID
jgi:GLPGLI family protein